MLIPGDDEESLICSSRVLWVASIIVGGKGALTTWPGSGARERAVTGDDILGDGDGVTSKTF
jgi:hypothetical protein